jgi:hypothetical protein
MKKVTVEVAVKLTINIDEDATLSEVISELDYDFTDTTGWADIEDMLIKDYEVKDSR